MSNPVSAIAPGALASIRVIELGTMVAAPICAQFLGDLGADVIKVEPIGGEVMRGMPPVYNGESAAFAQWNRNKRSIALDLKTAEGLKILRQLIGGADVFLQNWRVGGVDKLGLGYDQLSADHPELIYVNFSGYGLNGPYKDQPGYDMMVQALTGFMPIQGTPENPKAIRGIIADKVAGLSAALAVVAATIHLRSGGTGQRIDSSILNAYAALMLPDQAYTSTFLDAPFTPPWTQDLYNMVELKDGKVMAYINTDEQFRGTCDGFGLSDEVRNDPRFASPPLRNVNQPALVAAISQACPDMSVAECVAIAQKYRLPMAPVNNLEQFQQDPQSIENETFVTFDAEKVGRVRLLNGHSTLSKTPINARALAPSLGAHTDAILTELGLSRGEIADLHERGIVR